jgi:hypothetical protein
VGPEVKHAPPEGHGSGQNKHVGEGFAVCGRKKGFNSAFVKRAITSYSYFLQGDAPQQLSKYKCMFLEKRPKTISLLCNKGKKFWVTEFFL